MGYSRSGTAFPGEVAVTATEMLIEGTALAFTHGFIP